MQSGKVKGDAAAITINCQRLSLLMAHMACFIQLAMRVAVLADAAHKTGIAAMRLYNSYHFAALWPEVEYLAPKKILLVGMCLFQTISGTSWCNTGLFGINPLAFAWPRVGDTPVVFDMAASRLAKGDVMLATRDGHDLPDGTGLGPDGQPTNDPNEVLKEVLLPFGGYKGSAISMMVELLPLR